MRNAKKYPKIPYSSMVREREKLSWNPLSGSPPLRAHVYHVWSTSVNALVSYAAHRQSKWQNDRMKE